ncbi:hypothetical protein ACLOJK_007601 [Asimina triloba]
MEAKRPCACLPKEDGFQRLDGCWGKNDECELVAIQATILAVGIIHKNPSLLMPLSDLPSGIDAVVAVVVPCLLQSVAVEEEGSEATLALLRCARRLTVAAARQLLSSTAAAALPPSVVVEEDPACRRCHCSWPEKMELGTLPPFASGLREWGSGGAVDGSGFATAPSTSWTAAISNQVRWRRCFLPVMRKKMGFLGRLGDLTQRVVLVIFSGLDCPTGRRRRACYRQPWLPAIDEDEGAPNSGALWVHKLPCTCGAINVI